MDLIMLDIILFFILICGHLGDDKKFTFDYGDIFHGQIYDNQ